ncbi:MAG TPA: SMI1/KNR4 family protein [Luteolibacter sp.]
MSASPPNIWRVPVYLPYLQPNLTAEAIIGAELKLGVRLPDDFLALLRAQNGGYIRYSLDGLPHEQIYGIGPHFPSLADFNWDDDQDHVGFELQGLIPFDGDGHWHLCLDYRRDRATPAVSYIDIECDNEEEIAPTFSDYLKLLKLDVEDRDFVFPAVESVDELVAALSSEMGVRFEPSDFRTHGYPQYRARGPSKDPQWIWISPNLVPRGFVREDDSRYEELQNRLPGKALRYEGLPDSSYILTVTEGLRRQMLEACGARSIDIRPLAEFASRE